MPKDAKKNIDRYKIRGGDLNEFEFSQNQARVKEAGPGSASSWMPIKAATTESSTARKPTAKKSAKKTTAKESTKRATAKKSAKKPGKSAKKPAKSAKKPAKSAKKAAKK